MDQVLDMQLAFGAEGIAVESDAYQELLSTVIVQKARARGMPCPVLPLTTGGVDKQVRIRRLGPYLSQGGIRFKGGHAGTRLLVQQLQQFPLASFDDGPDGLEYSLRCMILLWNGRQAEKQRRTQGQRLRG